MSLRYSFGMLLPVIVLLAFSSQELPAQRGRPPGGGASGNVATLDLAVRSHAITVAGRLEPRSRIVHRIPASG